MQSALGTYSEYRYSKYNDENSSVMGAPLTSKARGVCVHAKELRNTKKRGLTADIEEKKLEPVVLYIVFCMIAKGENVGRMSLGP